MPQFGDIMGGVNAGLEFRAGYLRGQERRRKYDEQMKIQRLMQEAMGQGRGKFTYGPEKGFGMSVEPQGEWAPMTQEEVLEFERAKAGLKPKEMITTEYAETPYGVSKVGTFGGIPFLRRVPKKAGLPKYKEPTKWTPSSVEKVLGALEAGGYVEKLTGRPYRWRSRKEAENYALSQLGPDWKTKVPRALEVINRKWPGIAPEITGKDWWNE